MVDRKTWHYALHYIIGSFSTCALTLTTSHSAYIGFIWYWQRAWC